MPAHLLSFYERLGSLLMPRRCPACHSRMQAAERLICSECLLQLPRTAFADDPYENPMARLFWGRFPVGRVAAWFFYRPEGRPANLVKAMKYDYQPQLAVGLGCRMGTELLPTGFFDDIDLLVPIPLTPARQRQRGYNQSALLAKGLAQVAGLPVANRVVERTVFEQSQARMSAAERLHNVENVFRLKDPDAVAGRRLLVVDDVVTTGATMTSCCQELLKAPGTSVDILSLAFART